MSNVVTNNISRDLCSSCGVCVGLCPSKALSMNLQNNGDLIPQVNTDHCQDKCRICLDICPFTAGFHNPRKINIALFSGISDAKYNEDIGWYTETIVGFRKNKNLRQTSSSGGMATWFLEILLKKKLVTQVVVVRLAENHTNGFFEFFAASSVEELRASTGSVYHPVELSEIIEKIKSNKQERWAIIGVPCLCTAVRNSPYLRKKVPYVLGVACGMYQNTFYTEILLTASGVDSKHVKSIEYRRKSVDGPPNNYKFLGTDNQKTGREIFYHDLPFYLGKHAFFRLNACNFCMDVFAEAADACFMDAWVPEYRNEPKGTSMVVIRNRVLGELILQGQLEGELQFDAINPEVVVLSQRGHVRRKRELIYMRRGVQRPNNTCIAKPTTAEKINWWMERRTQTRSKKAWAEYGSKYGRFLFWLSLTDVLMMQTTVKYITKTLSLPKRLVNKFKRIFPQ